jgi:predicted O-methyltransferase YrrM
MPRISASRPKLVPKMIDKVSSWKFAEDFASEPIEIRRARAAADELGVESVTEATGNQLAAIAALTRAKSIVEVGTGAGVSALWLLSASEDSVITTIDSEPEYQNVARENFRKAEIAPARIRAISGKAAAVLKNMAESAYDLVFLDLDPLDLQGVLESAVSLAKPGGAILIAHAMWRDRVPNPTLRDDDTAAMRAVTQLLSDNEGFIGTMSLVGDGLLIAVKR